MPQPTRRKLFPRRGSPSRRRLVISQIESEKAAKARKGALAELIAKEKQTIQEAKARRERQREEQAAIVKAMTEFPNSILKIKVDKNGTKSLQRRERGQFKPSIKLNA